MHPCNVLVVLVFVFCSVCAANSMRIRSKLEQSSNLVVSDQEVQRRKHEKNETVDGDVFINQGNVTNPEDKNCEESCVTDEGEVPEGRALGGELNMRSITQFKGLSLIGATIVFMK